MIMHIKQTPNVIDQLLPNEIFVFGTNPMGDHTSRAALQALKGFGAVMGQSEGLFGQSYAIPVHKHRVGKMVMAVKRFIKFTQENRSKKFYVIPIGCGAAGMDPAFVALMFRDAVDMDNIYLPKRFVDELSRYYEIGVEISDDCMTIIRFPMHYQDKYVVPNGIEVLGKESFMGCFCQLELPESLKCIERYAFCDMGGYDYYLKIPSSVTHIDEKAFDGEWVYPGMLVYYKSYAYEFAKEHNIRYRCIDFDEEKYLMEQKEIINKNNRSIHSIMGFLNHLQDSDSAKVVPKGHIAIARDFGVVLNDDGHLTLFGNNEDFKQFTSSDRIIKVAASFKDYVGLTDNGRLVTIEPACALDKYYLETRNLTNIKDVVASEGHTVVLLEDGTVKSIDIPGWLSAPNHSKIVENWNNIKQVAVGYSNIMGLTEEGRVLYHSVDTSTDTHFYDVHSNIVQIDCYSHYYGTDSSAVLHADGRVSSDTFAGVETWKDIIQISVGGDIVIGLKGDGTIEMIDKRNERYAVTLWKDIACIECKFFSVIGITKDGQILHL